MRDSPLAAPAPLSAFWRLLIACYGGWEIDGEPYTQSQWNAMGTGGKARMPGGQNEPPGEFLQAVWPGWILKDAALTVSVTTGRLAM